MLSHTQDVREYRTSVKGDETVLAICDHAYMAGKEKVGEILLRLKARADLTLDKIAERAGYSGKSSIQEYFKREYEGPLGSKAAARLQQALVGLGSPAIEAGEISALTSVIHSPNVRGQLKFEGASLADARGELPVVGTALGAERIVDGEAVEQTELNTGDIITYVKRPAILNGTKEAYALYVQGSSMEPAFDDGDLLVAQRKQPLRSGDDVVVFLRPTGEDDDGERARMVLVKRLVRRTAQYIELQQFNPALTFRVAADDVLHIDRVMKRNEMLS